MSVWEIFAWAGAGAILGAVLPLALQAYASGWWERRMRPRRCQYCCTMMKQWERAFGVLNCKQCCSMMAIGWAPHDRCKDGTP